MDTFSLPRHFSLLDKAPRDLSMDQVKVKIIQDWPEPWKVKDIQSFLGLANFYWHFVFDYSDTVIPLTCLIHKKIPFQFTEKAQEAFKVLKEGFTRTLIINHWISDWPICLGLCSCHNPLYLLPKTADFSLWHSIPDSFFLPNWIITFTIKNYLLFTKCCSKSGITISVLRLG